MGKPRWRPQMGTTAGGHAGYQEETAFRTGNGGESLCQSVGMAGALVHGTALDSGRTCRKVEGMETADTCERRNRRRGFPTGTLQGQGECSGTYSCGRTCGRVFW